MSIDFDRFTDNDYFSYLQRLKKKNIDVSNIRVYSTRAGENRVYSVIYGVYDNRRIANKSLQDLPLVLKVNQPFTRTVGGIWNEINAL